MSDKLTAGWTQLGKETWQHAGSVSSLIVYDEDYGFSFSYLPSGCGVIKLVIHHVMSSWKTKKRTSY